jgi:hypothetical protein
MQDISKLDNVPNASEYHVQLSQAHSLKRIADALDRNNDLLAEQNQIVWSVNNR